MKKLIYKIRIITSSGVYDLETIETDREPTYSDSGCYLFRDKEGVLTHSFPIARTIITVESDKS